MQGYPPWHKLYGKAKPKPKFSQSRTMNVTQSTTTSYDADNSKVTVMQEENSQAKKNIGLSESQYTNLLQLLLNNLKTGA